MDCSFGGGKVPTDWNLFDWAVEVNNAVHLFPPQWITMELKWFASLGKTF
jgi:hypothetical protein